MNPARTFLDVMRRRQEGQSLVELALVIPVLLLLLAASTDFGFLYAERLEISNATRVGVRWASTHPVTWSNAALPADNTIEGQVIYAGDTRTIANDDTHIQVQYFDMTTPGSPVYCGEYVESTNLFTPASGYTQATCVLPGNLITVTVNYFYPPFTPFFQSLFNSTIKVTSTAAMLEQV